MAKDPKFSIEAVNRKADQMLALLNGGVMRLYDGVKPATADTGITTQTLLAECAFGTPAFTPAVGGIATANPIASATAEATGTATWFRTVKADGSPVMDGTVAPVGTPADFNLNSVQIQIGATVNVDGLRYIEAKTG